MAKGEILVSGMIDNTTIRFSTPSWQTLFGASRLDPIKTFDPVQDFGDLRPDIDQLLELDGVPLSAAGQ